MSWPLVHIGEHVGKVETWNPVSSGMEDLFKYIDLSSVDKDSKSIIESAVNLIHPISAPSRARQIVKENDVLISTVRPNLNGVALVNQELDGATASTGYCVLRANKKSLDSKYLFYWVQSSDFIDDMIKNATGANYPAVSDRIVKNNLIPLPPLEEQKRIAAILDKADTIRRKRQQAIKLADDFLRSVFLEMFGDPVTNPKGWEVRSISEYIADGTILQVQDGNHGNDHPKVSDFIQQGIPFVTANVVREGNILFDQCYYLGHEWLRKLRIGFAKSRDVLISHKGSLGFTAVLDDSFENYIFSPQTTYYRVNERRLIPEYLKGYFDSSYFQTLFEKEGIQSTRAYIGITRQKDLPLILPDIQSQSEYVKIYRKYSELRKKITNSKNSLPICFESLSQKAFSGQL